MAHVSWCVYTIMYVLVVSHWDYKVASIHYCYSLSTAEVCLRYRTQ